METIKEIIAGLFLVLGVGVLAGLTSAAAVKTFLFVMTF